MGDASSTLPFFSSARQIHILALCFIREAIACSI